MPCSAWSHSIYSITVDRFVELRSKHCGCVEFQFCLSVYLAVRVCLCLYISVCVRVCVDYAVSLSLSLSLSLLHLNGMVNVSRHQAECYQTDTASKATTMLRRIQNDTLLAVPYTHWSNKWWSQMSHECSNFSLEQCPRCRQMSKHTYKSQILGNFHNSKATIL